MNCRIALDAMGGDHAPDEIVKGALLAAAEYPSTDIILVGKEEVVRAKLAEYASQIPKAIEVVDAREVVEMEDTKRGMARSSPSTLRRFPKRSRSSMRAKSWRWKTRSSAWRASATRRFASAPHRSEEHTSELQS